MLSPYMVLVNPHSSCSMEFSHTQGSLSYHSDSARLIPILGLSNAGPILLSMLQTSNPEHRGVLKFSTLFGGMDGCHVIWSWTILKAIASFELS